MMDMHNCIQPHRHHFNGNGSCDAMREANHRADRATGMESELAPYPAEARALPQASAPGAGTQNGYGGAWSGTVRGDAAAAANGYDDPAYGPGHEWTGEEEEGMNSLPQDSFTQPMSASEAARNSWRALLARNVGRNVLVRFLMGTQNFITVEGELYEVGSDYIVIYQPLWDSHITADLYSVKFVEFREPPGQVLG
ncbi:MAG: hypothetical protein J5449_07125 [Oscillospiraceae bacterium]|nr:hypothetical protein [Oscillospiraceae bacterium]